MLMQFNLYKWIGFNNRLSLAIGKEIEYNITYNKLYFLFKFL